MLGVQIYSDHTLNNKMGITSNKITLDTLKLNRLLLLLRFSIRNIIFWACLLPFNWFGPKIPKFMTKQYYFIHYCYL